MRANFGCWNVIFRDGKGGPAGLKAVIRPRFRSTPASLRAVDENSFRGRPDRCRDLAGWKKKAL
jgi:hypothetical protein